MAQTIQLKRSATAGNIPSSSDLALGEIAINTADGAVYIKKGNNDIVAVHDNDILHIDTTNSRVGIGTTSPNCALHVNGQQLRIVNGGPILTLQDSTDDDDHTIRFQDNGGTTRYSITSAGDNFNFITSGTREITFQPNDSEAMRIDSSGNVGIGTTSPSAKLDVAGGIKASGDLVVSTDNLFVDVSTDRVGMGTSSPTRPLHVKDGDDVVAFFESTDTTAVIHIKDQTTGLSIGSDSSGNGVFGADIDQVGNKNILFKIAGTERAKIASTGAVTFNSAYTFPTSDGSANQVLQTDGSGNLSFADVSSGGGVTISNNVDNRVLTGDGTNANAEANLTFDGSTLDVTGNVIIDTSPAGTYGVSEALRIDDTGGTADRALQFFELCNAGARSHRLAFNTNITTTGSAYTHTQGLYGGSSAIHFGNSGEVVFYVNGQVTSGTTDSITPTERFRVNHDGDVQFDGGNVFYDTSQNALNFIDNVYAQFGTGNDLGIYHDGTDSRIHNATGNLYIRNNADDNDIIIQTDNGSGGTTNYMVFDGSNERIVVSKNVNFQDNVRARFGSSNDLHIYHDTTDSRIENVTGDLIVINKADDKDIIFQSDDGSGGTTPYLRLDGSTAEVNFHRTTKVDDNFYLGAGAGPDLYLMHDGTESHIRNNTGNLTIQNNTTDGDIIFRSDDGSGGTVAYMTLDGSDTSVRISQHMKFPDSKALYFGDGQDLNIWHSGTNSLIDHIGTGNLYLRNTTNDTDILIQTDDGAGGLATYAMADGSEGSFKLYHYGSVKLTTASDGVILTSTDSSNLAGPVLDFNRDSSSPADADYLGQLKFRGENDADQDIVFAKITAKAADVTDGTEDGALEFTIKKAGTNNINARLSANNLDLINGTGLSVAGNATITGNLTVNGSTVTNSATNTTIEDALIELGSGNTGANSNDLGLILERGTTGDNIFMGWDESTDRVRFATTTATGASSGDLTLTNANIQAGRLYGNVTGDVTGNADTATTAGTVTTAAQPNITSLGTLTTLTVDDITINGSTISDAGDLTFDVGGDIILDGDGADIILKDGGTEFGRFTQLIGGLAIGAGSPGGSYPMLLSSTKVLVFTDMQLGDDEKLIIGDGASGNLQIFHDGTDSFLDDVAEGNLILRTNGTSVKMMTGTENMVVATKDGSVDLYYNNSKKLETTNGGVNITGNLRVSSDVNDALIVGSGNESITFGGWDSGQSDISGLLAGSNFGSLITGGSNGHVVVGLRDNDVNDSFSVISGAGDYMTGTTYDKLAFQVNTDGLTTVGNRLDVKSQSNTLQRWYKGSTLIGQANAVSDVQMAIGTGDTGILFNNTTNEVYPWDVAGGDGSNNLLNLGNSTRKWKNLYVGSNIYVDGTVDGRDLQIDGNKLDGIEANATADQTASEILTAIKTVDGSGSGLDADLFDGLDSTAFRRRVFSTNITATPETRWIAFTKPFISGNGTSEYYHLDLVGYSDIGQAQSSLHYSAYIHVRSNGTSTNTFEVIIEERHKAGSEQFTFGKKQVASTSNIVYFILPEDYSGVEIYNLSDDVGSISTATSSMFSTTDTDPTGITTITPREPLHTNDNISVGTISSGNLTVTGDVAINSDDLVVSSSNSRVGINVGTPLATLDIDGDVYVRTGHTLFTDILRPYATSTLTIGQGTNDIAKFTGSIKIGNTTIIDSSRNFSNIGTISSGAITTSGTIAYSPAEGNDVVITNDGSYGTSGTGRYVTLGFSGNNNGQNRIFAHNTGGDGIYIASATGRNVTFRTNGGSSDTFRMTSDGKFQAGSSNTTILDANRNLQNIASITTGAVTVDHTDGTDNISLTPTSTGGVINARNSSGTSVVVMDGRGTPFIDVTGNLKTGGTTRIDSSGNLSSIGTISCGNITSDTIEVNTAINDNSHGLNITNGSLSGAGNLRIAIPKASGNYSTASQLGGITIRNETTGGNIVVGAKDNIILAVGGSDYDERLKVTTAGVDITGALTATTKSFDIEHPSKEGMRLRYGSLEGPENGVYVRGKSQEKVILLPDYWPDLIHEDSITVQLTAIGSGQELYVEKIEDNKVYVNGDNYFYYIQAERKDVERFEVEYEV